MFRLGAVLVGTHAFLALGNVLGVRWQSGLSTQDIDILASPVLEVAIGPIEADLPGTLESLNTGFLPVPGLDPRKPETSFQVRGRTLRVDLLTPAHGRRDGSPVRIPRLKASARPLEFLDYLFEIAVGSINRRAPAWQKKLRDGLSRLPDTLTSAKQRISAMLTG